MTSSTPCDPYDDRTASVHLRVIVVGAGLGGLMAAIALHHAGHTAVVLEAQTEYDLWQSAGGGLHISPNLVKALTRFGVAPFPKEAIVQPSSLAVKRYSDGQMIFGMAFDKELAKECGGELAYMSHERLQRMLYDTAIAMGVEIQYGVRVVSVDQHQASVVSASGQVFKGDLVVGADGINSAVRRSVLGDVFTGQKCTTQFTAFTLDAKLLRRDKELEQLLDDDASNCWVGPGITVIGHPVDNFQSYSVNIFSPCANPSACPLSNSTNDPLWTMQSLEPGTKDHLKGCEPIIEKLLNLSGSCIVSHGFTPPPLEKWVRDDSGVVLIGDAAHPTLPLGTKGTGMAIEDGAVLGNLLSHLRTRTQIPDLLRTFQDLRQERCNNAAAVDAQYLSTMTLPDGPAQQARDQALISTTQLPRKGDISQQEAATVAELVLLWNYDPFDDVDEWWLRWGRLSELTMGVPNAGTRARGLSVGIEMKTQVTPV